MSDPYAARTIALQKTYGHGDAAVHALRDVSVDIPVGKFTAIMGPSGSGKSTLMHCLAGLDTATAGTVLIGDTDLSRCNDSQRTRLRRRELGFVFQSFNLLPVLTARANILLPLTLDRRSPDELWFDELVAVLGIGDRLDHKPGELSGGQQQRVAIARALLGRPRLILADEPTGNLDSRSGAQVLSLLQSSSRRIGQTIVMVTHDPVAASYCDQVLVMADGRMVDRILAPTADSVLAAMRGHGTDQVSVGDPR
ncbi:ABC transporter ATP-binding protein [Williamsia muralis]|uniref:Putative ABC transport system ATP-binding protein n=1 Tax=Williamsia marianensis TaxID=85044 RepID=A0A495K451_WILMA|nr:ABC transporter ATP-binding protein [Williamsia muralis]RKR96060.1 putative ABC transport system ATP-binding protein [Williamsia muralis]